MVRLGGEPESGNFQDRTGQGGGFGFGGGGGGGLGLLLGLVGSRFGIERPSDAAGETIAGAGNRLDFKQSGGDVRANPADLADGAVEAVVADDHSAPALVEKLVAGHHPAVCVEQQ